MHVTHRPENWTHPAENWTHSAEKLTHRAKNWTHWPYRVDTSPSSRRPRRPGPELAEGEGISTSFRARFPANARRRRPDTSLAKVNTLPSKVNTFGNKLNTLAPNLNTLASRGEHMQRRRPPASRPPVGRTSRAPAPTAIRRKRFEKRPPALPAGLSEPTPSPCLDSVLIAGTLDLPSPSRARVSLARTPCPPVPARLPAAA